MMPSGEALDDDYVISLLKKDADANQKRYLEAGFGSLLSKRPTGSAPKPNTRFLKHIIRETDNHNEALKVREREESKTKLRELKAGEKRSRDDDPGEQPSKKSKGDEKPGRWASVLGGLNQSSSRRKRDERNEPKDVRESKSQSVHHREKRSMKRDHHHESRRRKQDRHLSPQSRGHSPRHRKEERRRNRNGSPDSPVSTSKQRNDDHDEPSASDSDPLDDVIGPKPAPKSLPRGRGAYKSSSSMDARFDPAYDPKTDVNIEPDHDRDDWDMALEALRDRAKWKAQGADRLKAAGFTDREIETWEKDGEKGIEDVRWRKKGEGREWDRGKTINKDGTLDTRPEWGRLREA